VENLFVIVTRIKMERYFVREIEIPEGCTIEVNNRIIKVTGAKGTVERDIKNKLLKHDIQKDKIVLFGEKGTKPYKKIVLTFVAHINNMFKGVVKGHVYKLKVCSGHFPMTAAIKGDTFELKNFIGEAKPRKLKLNLDSVSVKVNGTDIVVEGIDKEKTAQTAASIESLTKRPGFDKRIFQDGIYIINKDGKAI
jgi:large subunit ribosomal protein L6